MAQPIKIRFGGYSPPESSHSQAVVYFKEALKNHVGDAVQVDHYWNVLDFGYQAHDLLSMVECGLLTMCYFSSSYVTKFVPELEIIDLPFMFENEEQADAVLDGGLGKYLTEKTEGLTGFRVLGYWDNGFRHLSNRLRPVHTPADCKGMRIRLQPNDVHVKTFELLGTVPVPVDLREGIAMIESGEVDAQENPLANMITYGVNKHHHHVTMTAHFYGARGIYVHKETFDSWSDKVRTAVLESVREAIEFQRELAAAKGEETRSQLEAEGVKFVDLTADERAAFVDAVKPIMDDARKRLGDQLFTLAAP